MAARFCRVARGHYRKLKRLGKLGNDLAAYVSCLDLLAIDEDEWAVEGRLPFAAVTLLLGDGGAGKSTSAHELYAAVNAEEAEGMAWRQGCRPRRGDGWRGGDALSAEAAARAFRAGMGR